MKKILVVVAGLFAAGVGLSQLSLEQVDEALVELDKEIKVEQVVLDSVQARVDSLLSVRKALTVQRESLVDSVGAEVVVAGKSTVTGLRDRDYVEVILDLSAVSGVDKASWSRFLKSRPYSVKVVKEGRYRIHGKEALLLVRDFKDFFADTKEEG